MTAMGDSGCALVVLTTVTSNSACTGGAGGGGGAGAGDESLSQAAAPIDAIRNIASRLNVLVCMVGSSLHGDGDPDDRVQPAVDATVQVTGATGQVRIAQ